MIALVAWLGLVGALAVRGGNEHAVEPIDPDAMVLGPSQERWMGIFFQDQQVGFAVRRTSPVEGGSTLFEGRSQFQVATFGKLQQVSTAGTALVDPSGVLERFDFIMLADQVRLVARGEVAGQEIVMEIDQAGETSILRFPISKPPQVGMSLEGAIRRQDLRVGHSFAVPYFDPLTLAEGEMRFDVTDVEVMASGEEAYWLKARFGEIETRSLITPSGETLRQEGSLGMSMVRMTAKEAQVLSGGEPIDLIDASAVPLEPGQTRLDSPRQTRVLKVRVKGVSVDKIPSNPPHQVVTGDTVRIETPLALELPAQPFIRDVPGQWLKREIIGPELQPRPPEWTESSPALGLLSALDPYNLRSTPTIPAQHREIQDKAREVIGDATHRRAAVKRLVDFVFSYVSKEPSVGVPNGLAVLRSARGDCNEHTALFVSMARSVGIESRIAAGLVYSNRVGPRGAFYYHAWPEVLLGADVGWVAVDPTFGQMPADATHIKLVEGDLDRQVEIIGMVGRLRLELIEYR
jgi:hypothetical protein